MKKTNHELRAERHALLEHIEQLEKEREEGYQWARELLEKRHMRDRLDAILDAYGKVTATPPRIDYNKRAGGDTHGLTMDVWHGETIELYRSPYHDYLVRHSAHGTVLLMTWFDGPHLEDVGVYRPGQWDKAIERRAREARHDLEHRRLRHEVEDLKVRAEELKRPKYEPLNMERETIDVITHPQAEQYDDPAGE